MKKLAIGTKVSYTLSTSILSNRAWSGALKESKVVGHEHDGRFNWVCLENGDKMFKEALTIVEENEIQRLEKKLESPMFDGFKNENLKHYLQQRILDLSKKV